MDFGEVLLYGAHVLGIVDAAAFELVVVVEAALVDVVEGEETEDAAVAFEGVDFLVSDEIAAQVAVREHDSFGQACGAGGVDEGYPVVGFDGVFEVRHNGAVFLAAGNTGFEDFEHAVFPFDVGKGVDDGRVLHFVERRFDAAQEYVVADKDVLGFAVGEDVLIVVGAEGGVDGHMDDAGEGEGHVHEVPLRAVGGDGDDFVAGLEPHFDEAAGEIV